MGEAKRRQQQGRDRLEALRRRRAAGDFGPDGRGYLVVLDKSPVGQDLLAALGELATVLPGLPTPPQDEALRLWQMSATFAFALLHGGPDAAPRRSLLAADRARLLAQALPRARRRLAEAGLPCGLVLAVSDEEAAALGLAALQPL